MKAEYQNEFPLIRHLDEKARGLINAGKYSRAIHCWEKAFELSPDRIDLLDKIEKAVMEEQRKIDDLMSESLDFYRKGDYDQAKKKLEKVLEMDPGHYAANRHLTRIKSYIERAENEGDTEGNRLDKRRYFRIHETLSLKYVLEESFEGIEEPAVVLNFSLGGILFEAERRLPPAARLYLIFHLPDNTEPIRVLSRIVRQARVSANRHLVAAKIIIISEKNRTKLQNYAMEAAA